MTASVHFPCALRVRSWRAGCGVPVRCSICQCCSAECCIRRHSDPWCCALQACSAVACWTLWTLFAISVVRRLRLRRHGGQSCGRACSEVLKWPLCRGRALSPLSAQLVGLTRVCVCAACVAVLPLVRGVVQTATSLAVTAHGSRPSRSSTPWLSPLASRPTTSTTRRRTVRCLPPR